MAKFEIGVDLDLIRRQLKGHEEKLDEITDKMLLAGADAAVAAQKASAQRHGHINTGDMLKSIKPTKIKKKDGEKSIEIYPHGKDRKGVSNAQKAFVLNYGRSNRAGSRWVEEATEQCSEPAQEAMAAVMEEALKNAE